MPKQVSIGRDDSNDIVIAHPYLSGRHALLTVKDPEKKIFHIQDLDTTNGTYKNGEQIKDADFTLDDTIKVGNSVVEASMFLPLLFGDAPAAGKKSGKSQPSKSGQSAKPVYINSRLSVNPKLIAAIAIALLLSAISGFLFNQSFDASVLLQIISMWAMLLMAMYLTQVVMHGSQQLDAEKQYRRLMFDQWQNHMGSELKRQQQESARETDGWSGFRKFEIKKRVEEADGIVSFYLTPHDKKELSNFRPGQYLTFRLDIPGQDKPVIRCYSLSDRFHEAYYRVSIKKIPPPPKNPEFPPGLSSSFFHEQLKTDAIVDVKAPSGKFYLNEDCDTGVVLIAGGIGLTPMISMLNTLTNQGSKRDIWFFYGVRNSDEVAMLKHLKSIDESFDNVHLQLCFSNPGDQDILGENFHHQERVSVELFKKLLPSNNFEYYMCGPPPMMQSVNEDLGNWGVPEKDIYFEAFGPASVKKKKAPAETSDLPKASAEDIQVEFVKSGKKLTWSPDSESILEFAESNNIEMESGCRAGNCGTCQVAMRSGNVRYTSEHDIDVENGSCLACISVPSENLVLDA